MNASTTPGRQLTLPIAIASLIIPLVILGISFSKPFTIDDTLFMAWSRHISPLPGEQRVETINWSGTEEPMVNQTRHYPPGWAIIIAGTRRICGDDAGKLRLLLQLPFAFMFLFGSAILAIRFGVPPWPVMGLCATSPLFLVPLASLMPDIACLGPATLGVALWIGAATMPRIFGAAILIILSAQMKQTVLPILPLLLVEPAGGLLKDWRKLTAAIAVILLSGAYPPVGHENPGVSISGHASWIINWAWSPQFMAPKFGYALAVLGALALSPAGLFASFILPRRISGQPFSGIKGMLAAVVFIYVLSGTGFWKAVHLSGNALISPVSGWTLAWFQSCIIVFLAWAWQAWTPPKAGTSAWLVAWILFCVLGYLFGTPFPASRFLVFITPALAIIYLKDAESIEQKYTKLAIGAAISGNLFLSAGLLHSDNRFAESVREGAERGAELACASSSELLTTGHWGLQYYVEAAGGRVLDGNKGLPKTRHLILVPEMTDHRDYPFMKPGAKPPPATWSWGDYRNFWFLPPVRTVMPRKSSACFHGGNVWLPYGFSKGQVETITIMGNYAAFKPRR